MKKENKKEKTHKFSAFVNFNAKGLGKMEFSNSLNRLRQLIFAPDVVKVIILEGATGRKLQTLKNKIHI